VLSVIPKSGPCLQSCECPTFSAVSAQGRRKSQRFPRSSQPSICPLSPFLLLTIAFAFLVFLLHNGVPRFSSTILNHQKHTSFRASTASPGQGQFYGPPPGAPPPNMASRPYNYHPPNGPPPTVYDNAYRQGQHGAPPPPQHAQMFNHKWSAVYVPVLQLYRKTKGGPPLYKIPNVVGALDRSQLFRHVKTS